jgi:thioredoxin-related protein
MRGKIDFKRYDGDDGGSASLKEKYGVKGYPTLVFTDNSGKALLKQGGAPGSAADFKDMINGFMSGHGG